MPRKYLEWKTKDDLEIYSKAWQTAGRGPRPAVCLIHGVGEHIGRFQPAAEGADRRRLSLRRFRPVAGPAWARSKFESYFAGVDLFLAEVARRWTGLKRFLQSHSARR